VLAAPRVSVPAPFLVSAPLPDSRPDKVKLLAPDAVRPPALTVIALPRVRPLLLAPIAPPLAVIGLLPKAAPLSKLARPPLSVASVLTSAPCRFQVPLLTVRCWKLM